MSYDVHWFRPAGDAPLLEQARADRPGAEPSPEHDARRQAFVDAFLREFPDAVMKPEKRGFSHGCWFVHQDEDGDEGAEAESDFGNFWMGVDDALFNRALGGHFAQEPNQTIARLLFEHGFVAWDPQANRVLSSAPALWSSFDMPASGEGNEDFRAGLVLLAIIVGVPLLLTGLALYTWLG